MTITFVHALVLPVQLATQSSSQALRGSTPHSPCAFILDAPALSSPHFSVPLIELELQIRKLKCALDEFNLRNDEPDLRFSQGSGCQD